MKKVISFQEGQVGRYLAFVESGLAMYYKTRDSPEIPIDFATEQQWMGNLDSFTNKTPADVSIKALEHIKLQRLSAENFEIIFNFQPKFILLKDYYTQLSFINHTRPTADLAILNAKQRYYKNIQNFAQKN